MAEEIVTLILVSLIPIIVLFLTLKGDKLSKDIARDRVLLEEAFGPLKGKIGRIALVNIPSEKVVANVEIAEEIVDIRDRFEYEFSEGLRKIIDFFIQKTYFSSPAPIYKEKINSLAEDSPIRVRRRAKVYLDEYPQGILDGKAFMERLEKLVNDPFIQIENSLENKLMIQKNFGKFIEWSLIGYRWRFSVDKLHSDSDDNKS